MASLKLFPVLSAAARHPPRPGAGLRNRRCTEPDANHYRLENNVQANFFDGNRHFLCFFTGHCPYRSDKVSQRELLCFNRA